MTPTSRLYYPDSYTSAFDAQVIDSSPDRKRVYLDKTYFYPTSGGQPHDTGLLAGQTVLDVIDEGDRIAHLLAAPVSTETVAAQIDWSRRYDHMQQHTGQHLLSAVFMEVLKAPTLSFHLGSEVSTIELGIKELSDAGIDAVENRANEIAREGRSVQISFAEADQAGDLRKESSRMGTLRIVEITGIDRSACGGTHLRSTAELGLMQIRNLEKIRSNIRVEFVCGVRALRRSKEDFRILSRLARESATSPEKLSEYVKGIKERLSEGEKEQSKLVFHLAERDAADLYAAAQKSDDGLRRVLLRVPAIDTRLRATASAFAAHSEAAILLLAEEPPSVLLACSPDSNLHAGTTLKDVLGKIGGRGGGSPTLAQGSLPRSEAVGEVIRLLGFGNALPKVR